ncbi:cytochrome c554/c'-like protein [Marinobacterium halophilum]|uniref:Cytochrome c554/c'-like protein n=1 Tax=Marinobacterium halophilum TaxID=267374 RepID=A0A2P8ETU1_9GAMM|nr:tetratricopeptide repeat protein [Marinobacterium halophilum]PSL12874.1 cytochrome c554/c'-like protein [Marinobacterium halophilum]
MNHLITFVSLLILQLLQPVVANEAERCLQCHEQETREWQASQHAHSMQPASTNTLLGNFDHGHFVSEGLEAEFYREEGQYRVNLIEAGQKTRWTVSYSFGIYPLQQYLIDIGDGKLQALNIAWDSRSADAGGQRWFRLDDPGHQPPGAPLHWRGVYQNWNSMCADCHSTGLSKAYSPGQDRYDTRFEQINVSCSACHADASVHAQAAQQGRTLPAGVDLRARGAWLTGTTEQKPQHTGPLSSSAQVETCGRCHALRTRLDQTPSGRIHNQYRLNRLHSPLYFPDGRVREEVFVLGSFLQSNMHRAGVVCSNCHNPHSAQPIAEGNALCGQCHAAASFDRREHHRHPQDSTGAQCISCHMPERTYMQVDPRREHNFTTPNPVTAQRAGSPDPCLACHDDQSREWSIQQLTQLWPDHRERADWFEIQQADLPAMAAFIADPASAPLYRASLLEQQAPALAQIAPALILEQLQSPNPLLRESSWTAAANLPVSAVRPHANAGLHDERLSVRLAAFETLLRIRALPTEDTGVRREYEDYLTQQADRPAGRTLSASYELTTQPAIAEQNLNIALQMDNAYQPAYILLTELLRSQQRFDEAIELLKRGLEVMPDNANLHHLRGLTRLQLRQIPPALDDLALAWRQAPDNADFGYRYALALYHTGDRERAHLLISQLLQQFPQHPSIARLRVLLKPAPSGRPR